MTQKEYREKLKQYEDEIAELRIKLDKKENQEYQLLEVLRNYYEASTELEAERRYNEMNSNKIAAQNMIIEKYEKILGRITINEG